LICTICLRAAFVTDMIKVNHVENCPNIYISSAQDEPLIFYFEIVIWKFVIYNFRFVDSIFYI
jgi:hypothetical protein